MSFDLKIENGDIKIGDDSDLAKAQNSEKLIQDILKITTTPLGGNPFFPWYGCPINKTLIGLPISFEFIDTLATAQLRSSLEMYQKIQKIQAASGQKVTPSELLAAIQQIKIERNQTDARYFSIIIKALTKELTQVTTSFAQGP